MLQEPRSQGGLIPPLGVGDRADYAGPYDLTWRTGSPRTVLDAGLDRVEAVPVTATMPDGVVIELDLHPRTLTTMRLVNTCAIQERGACLDWYGISFTQGAAAVFGATYLQGRDIRIGETWNVEEPCDVCGAAVQVAVTAPTDASPPGTEFVASIRGNYTMHSPQWVFGSFVLHMTWQHPYPLKVQMGDESFRLIRLTRGTPLAGPGDPPASPEPLARIGPTRNGLPPEGEPLEGHPTFAAAVAADPEGRPVAGTAGLTYSFRDENVSTADVGLRRDHTYEWLEGNASPAQARQYRHTVLLPDAPASVDAGWFVEEVPAQALPFETCPSGQAVQTWDAIRAALAAGWPSRFTGYDVVNQCGDQLLMVHGPAPDLKAGAAVSISPVESVWARLDTGLVTSALLHGDTYRQSEGLDEPAAQ